MHVEVAPSKATVLGCLPFTKRFRKIRLERKWNITFLVAPAENFRSNGTSEKVVLFSRAEYSKQNFVFHFFKAIFDTHVKNLAHQISRDLHSDCFAMVLTAGFYCDSRAHNVRKVRVFKSIVV